MTQASSGNSAPAPQEGDPHEPSSREPGKAKAVGSKLADPDLVLQYADQPVASLDELLAALEWAFTGEDVPKALLERFAQHARLVLLGNQRMNLTSILDPREVAAKHVLDSWRATRLLPLAQKKVLDLGSGPGYPGVPMALAEPQCSVTLLDSMAKRAQFLEQCVGELGLSNCKAVHARGEEHLLRARYDMVVLRSISSVRENVRLLRKVKHSIRDLVMLKGPAWSRETRAAEREAERLGFRLDTVWEHALPGELGQRAILVYRAPGSQA